ncbi:uncharacterized protein Achl [Bactrocera oleae]|uniref:uncharacterized protein Achl n=1 Tax=Bactrocera oleae TaxID=104688 RepID=UPI0006B72891|nr:uncharacterized protein LOC106618449 [Bactrocera oleae]
MSETPDNQLGNSESSAAHAERSEKFTDFEQELCQVNAGHANGGHTFVVTTVITETITETENQACILSKTDDEHFNEKNSLTMPKELNVNNPSPTTSTSPQLLHHSDLSKAVVPISSSLPSKLLRFHAKRSAEALLQQVGQSQSLDSQFGSDEGAVGGSEYETNQSPDVFDIPIPLGGSHAPLTARSRSVECYEDKLIDVGMGSSIEDSEESEEDDELKPLAVDNHVLHDVILSSSPVECDNSQFQTDPSLITPAAAVLSEANLEKFHKHNGSHQNHHNDYYRQMDNIYLHPNFKLEPDATNQDIPEASPPPAVAPANSPTEPKRVHRSFLTMKKPSISEPAETEEHIIKAVDYNSTSSPTENNQKTELKTDHSLTNEIDTLDLSMIPSEELAAEITEAVEFYFSNDSILKDAFLLKHVRRNKEGFVSLKLVSSFKRVRQLTKEWKVVGDALRRKSQKIELNDVGTKVRRIEPLPNFDETMPSRTVVACDLPLDKLTIEKVSEIFSKCGEIALIRILKPGMTIPVDVRQFMNKYPEVQQKECALVEYLESSSAREAKNLQGPFQVFEMVAPKKKTGKKAIIQVATPVARMVENYRYYNDATYERTRGGSFSGIVPHDVTDLRYKFKRFNSDIHPKPLPELHHNNVNGQPHFHHTQHNMHSSQHRGNFGNELLHQFQAYQPRVAGNNEPTSPGVSGNNNAAAYFYAYSPRRYSNNSTISAGSAPVVDASVNTSPVTTNTVNKSTISNSNSNLVRRLSNCSDNYSSFSDSRRPSNCSENMSQRRDSNCSENCPCSRRISDFGLTEVYRKMSQSSTGSGGERRFSNGSMQFERTFSNPNEMSNSGNNNFPRRISNDYNFEQRKQSVDTQTDPTYDDPNVGGGGGGYNVFPRRYSNNFNAANKMAAYDNAQYINGRRISTDSGYDRRYSFGSEYEGSPRSRTGSFLNNYKHAIDFDGPPRSRTGSFLDNSPRSRSGSFAQRNSENLVRTPIGPDGSKGFAGRARKFGQTISPVN